ncbi:hypothetical protein PybrP1_001491 [[Pythium] brassicae (nom. inval.)]|nr:hypothetical protein PybrP1_001491 [[Pythium] brassicae (nom. inval.)]
MDLFAPQDAELGVHKADYLLRPPVLMLLLSFYIVVANQLIVLVQPINAVAGEPFVLQPVVALTDDNGNILTSISTGTVRASIGVNPARFASVQPTTNSFAFVNGVAKCSGLYINLAAVGYTLLMVSMSHGVRTETAAFDVVVGLRYTISIAADISTAYGGTPFLPQPAAAIVDKGGNRVEALYDGTIRVEIVKNPVSGRLLPAGNLNVTIGAGVGRFQGVYIDVAGSPYTLRYTTDLALPGGSSIVTNPFTVAAGVCNNLVLLNTPVQATGGKAFGVQPVLKMIDSGGNTLKEDSSSVLHVAIMSNPSGGALSPAQSLKAYVRQGVATFRGLRIDKAGDDYTLVFTLYTKIAGREAWEKTEIEQVSPPFNVVVGRSVALFLQQTLSDGVLDGQPNEHQPVVALLDAGGNVVSSIVTGSVVANLVPSAGVASSIVVDTSAASQVSVVTVKALPPPLYPTPYGVGMKLSIEVTFSDEVLALGVPTLTLATSTTGPNGVAECVTLNLWSTKLVFQYSVVVTDNAADLNYLSTSALSLNGGSIKDRNMRTPSLTLPALASTDSLAATSSVVIDTTAPVITSVSSTLPGNGEFGTGEEISISVAFSRPITVYGSPFLPLVLTAVGGGAAARTALFVSGNNTDTLVFLYVVQAGDATLGTVLGATTSVNTNGGFLKHYSTRPTTDAVATMPAAPKQLAAMNSIVIDTAIPVVDPAVGVTSLTSNGAYAPGDDIRIVVTFTKPVKVTGFPRLYLETGSIKRPAGYTTGDGTKALTFVYTISSFDSHKATGNAHLNYRDATALELSGGSIKRFLKRGSGAADAVLSLAGVTAAGKSLQNNAQIDIDGVAPVVLSVGIVSTPANTVVRGDKVTIAVSFSSRVVVDTTNGVPSLQLQVGDYNRQANYVSGSGSLALLFSYTVMLGDRAPGGLDYRSRSALELNKGEIRRAILSFAADVVAGEYGTNHVITLTVTFSDEVVFDAPPELKMNTNTLVPYVSGRATNQLIFMYIVRNGDAATSFNKFDDAAFVCDPAACAIINYNGEAVATTLAGIDLSPANVGVSTAPPVVVSVYSPTFASAVNGNAFVVGDKIDIVVEMSLSVFIEPPPSAYPEKAPILVLNTGASGRDVLCQGYYQSNRKLLYFKYIVQEGDMAADLTYVNEQSLTLNSGQSAVKRFSTTPTTDAILVLPAPAPLGKANNQVLKVDTSRIPSVVSVSATNANGVYRCGDVLELVVTLTQHVVVLGSPFLWLDLGASQRKAVYLSGSGSTTLKFAYPIEEGDYSTDVEYVDHHSLDASDASTSILHLSTNPTTLANLDLPYPFSQNSLGFSKDLVVNGRKPTVVSTAFASPDGKYSVDQKVLIDVVFSACVTVDFGPNNLNRPQLRFQPSGVTTIVRYGNYVSGSASPKLRFEYAIQVGDTSADLDYADSKAIVLNGARILTCPADPLKKPVQSADLHLNPPGGRLLGAATKPIVFGLVRYTDLVVDRLGFDYKIEFQTQIGSAVLEASSYFDVLYSACYGLRSAPYASGDRLGSSVDIDSDTLALGGPGAQQPVSAVQIVTAVGDSPKYVDEIQTITTSATQRPAIQEVTTSAAPGETLGGWFFLQLGAIPTRRLYYNFDDVQVRVALELDLGFGLETIRVSRRENTFCACEQGFIWTITFMYVEGALAPLTTVNQLTGRLATVGDGRGLNQARVLVESTTVGGFFALQTANLVTRNINFDASESELTTALTQDLALAVRGLSRTPASAMRGYTWSITFAASEALYDVPQLTAQLAGLLGYQARLTIRTLREGLGRLSGFFRLRFRDDIFPADETDNIPVAATELQLETALEKLVSVVDVQVVRSAAANDFGGYSWAVTFVQVNTKNQYGPVVDTSGTMPALVPVTAASVAGKPTTLLKGTNAHISVQVGGYDGPPVPAGDTHWGLPGDSAGMVSIFVRGDYDWRQQGSSLRGADTRAGDLFGSSVSVKGDNLLVGAPAAAVFGDSELQNMLCDADGGFFRFVYRGKASDAVPFSADRMALKAAVVSVMSVSASEVDVVTPFAGGVCSGAEITIALRTGDHADSAGNVVDLSIDASSLTKGAAPGSGLMREYRAGTFKKDGVGSKGLQCGAAYLFRRDTGVWSQRVKLTPPPDLIFDVQEFGATVAVHDVYAAIGAPGVFDEEGRVFVYGFNVGSSTWTLFQTLSAAPNDRASGDRFGEALAISGSPLGALTIVVGAPGYASDAGAVFVFDLLNGRFLNRQFILMPTPELRPGDRFGNAVDLDMVTTFTLVVGAERSAFRSGADSGLAVVLARRTSADTFFTVQQVLFGSDTRARDRFGASVALSKDTVLVGAHEVYQGPRTIRKPVQSITTSTLDGSAIISGSFTMSLNWAVGPPTNTVERAQTRAIASTIDAASLEVILESDLKVGKVLVQRVGPSATNGFTWYLTFTGSTSDLPLVEVDDAALAYKNPSARVTVEWVVRVAPVLRGNVYVFTRDGTGKWTEQATLFPREKQYFSWFGAAVAINQRSAVVGAPNLDTYESGTNAGGGFAYNLGIFSLQFSSKTYTVLEGGIVDVTVQRCSRSGGFCAMDVAAAPTQYVNFDTGDAFSDQRSQNYVPVIPDVGPYQKMAMLEAVPFSSDAFFAPYVAGQEPFPQVARGRWLRADAVGTAIGRNQFYGSAERRSLWIDAQFDYAGVSDYVTSVGELFFDSGDQIQTFQVATTDDLVVEDPDETVVLRLSLPGVWPSADGRLWSTLTIRDNGDGGTGTRVNLDMLTAGSAGQSGSQYSAAVSVFDDGNIAIVGAPLEKQALATQSEPVQCGAVYFYARRSGYWELSSKVFPAECADGMLFGASVAIDGSLGTARAIVGAPGAAAAYLYRRQGATWMQDVRLQEASASARTHNYGGAKAVGIFGDVAVVGVSGLESVFVYHRVLTGWELTARLFCSDRQVVRILEQNVEQENRFGHAVALHRRTIVVGAPHADAGAFASAQYYDRSFDRAFFGKGAAYVFHIQAQEQTIALRTDGPLTAGQFCLSTTYRGVAGTTKIVSFGASASELKAALQELSVIRIVEVTRSGTIDQGFTWRVTFIGDILSVPLLVPQWSGFGCADCTRFSSTFKADPAKQMLVAETLPIGAWEQHARLTAPDGNAGDEFGSSVAISGEQVIVGAPSSSALVTTTWNFETGDLTGWLTTGTAFDSQPTFGDNSYARINPYKFRPYMNDDTGQRALHKGRYWVGTFESRPGAGKQPAIVSTCAFANDLSCKVPNYRLPGASPAGSFQGDGPTGSMTSQAFTVLGPWLSFLIGGGCDIRFVYVELLVDSVPTLKKTGRCEEGMQRVRWDVTPFLDQTAQLRVVDATSGDVWGHINFDDVRFSWDPAQATTPKAGAAYAFRRKAPTSLDPCVNMNRKLCNWEFQARLVVGDKRSESFLGFDVAVDDSTGVAVVAAPGQRAFDANNLAVLDAHTGYALEAVGSVYVFQRAGEVRDGKGVLLAPPKWSPKEIAKLQYPRKEAFSKFGFAVALDRSALVVGAPWLSTSPVRYQAGQAFYYDAGFATVAFTSSVFSCVEGNPDGLVSLTITRAGTNVSAPLTVGYATEDLSAVSVDALKYGSCINTALTQRTGCYDYQQLAGEVTFAAGETSKQIIVPIVDDLCYELQDEYFVVRLNVPGGEALVGEQFVARVRIDDDDFAYDPC